MDTSPWFVIPNRAFFVEETGGAWVLLTRDVWLEEIGQAVDETAVSFYGPTQAFA